MFSLSMPTIMSNLLKSSLVIYRHHNAAITTTTTLHPFNGRFSRTTWVSQYQKGKTSLDLNEARDDGVLGRQWHRLGRTLQTDNHTNTSSLNFYRSDSLPGAQPCQSTEGKHITCYNYNSTKTTLLQHWNNTVTITTDLTTEANYDTESHVGNQRLFHCLHRWYLKTTRAPINIVERLKTNIKVVC